MDRENRILLNIKELSDNKKRHDLHILILQEAFGERRIPIIIGRMEAYAIALSMRDEKAPRPLTHELLYETLLSFNSQVVDVEITNMVKGVFFAFVNINKEGQIVRLEARPSDAIALAIRFDAPIYACADVLERAGIEVNKKVRNKVYQEKKEGVKEQIENKDQKLNRLKNHLEKAVKEENYEEAASIKRQIEKINN